LKQPIEENPLDIQQIIEEFVELLEEGEHTTARIFTNHFS